MNDYNINIPSFLAYKCRISINKSLTRLLVRRYRVVLFVTAFPIYKIFSIIPYGSSITNLVIVGK